MKKLENICLFINACDSFSTKNRLRYCKIVKAALKNNTKLKEEAIKSIINEMIIKY